MAGVIKNVISTLFTSSGADSVVASTNKVSKGLDNVNKSADTFTRSTTRQGQASAGASRQFAAQASGLGGLVAAYAGAAATLFAVQAAYEALAQAAKSETVIKGTSALAAATAQSGPAIIKTIKDITDGQLTMAEAAQNASTALAAGFNTQQIEDLSRVAQKASMALGRDFTDSLQRITRGVAKLEPELLDELGIFTRIEPAVQKYARELGISAKTLNEFQRRQAFANAAIEEGDRKFSMIDTSAQSLQKTLEQLRVNVSELFTSVMQIIGSALSPFVDFLNNNVGAGILAFGFLLSKIFSKATQEVGMFADRSGAKLSGWAGSLADKAAFAEGTIESLRAAIMKPINAEKGAGLAQIRTAPRVNQDKAQAARFETALRTQRESADLSPSALNAINIAYKEQLTVLEQLDPKNAKNTQSFKNLTAAVQRNEAAIVSAGGRIKGFIGLSNTLKGAAAALTVGFRGLAMAVEGIFFFITAIQLVGTLFDIDLLGAVLGMFKDLSTASKEMADGFKGIAVAAAGGGVALTAELKRLGATQEQVESFGDSIVATNAKIRASANNMRIADVISGETKGPIDFDTIDNAYLVKAATDEVTRLQQEIKNGENEWFNFWGNGADEIEAMKIELLRAKIVLDTFKQGSEMASRAIAQIATTSGLSAEQLAKVFTTEITNSTKSLSILGLTIEKVNGSYSLENLTAEQRKLIDITGLSRNTATEFATAVKAGAVTVTSTGATLAGLEGNLLISKAAYDSIQGSVANLTAEEIKHRTSLGLEIAAQQKVVDSVRAVEAALIDIETRYAALTSVFSADIKILDTAEAQGVVDAFGKIALSQEQIAMNQATYLAKQIQSSAYAKDIVGDEKAIESYVKQATAHLTDQDEIRTRQQVLTASIAKDAELYAAATKAVEGRLVNIVISLNDMAKSYDSISADITKQLTELSQQQTLLPLQVAIDESQFAQEAAKSAASFQEAFIQNKIKLAELAVDAKTLTPTQGAEEINKLNSELLAKQQAAATEQHTLAMDTLYAEEALLDAKLKIDSDNIRQSAELQRNKIKSDYETLKNTAAVFSSISSKLQQAALTGGNAMGQAIVDGMNSAIKAFIGSLGSLGTIFNFEPQLAQFTPVSAAQPATVMGPAGMPVSTPTELELALTATNTAMEAAINNVTALEDAQLKATANTYLSEQTALAEKRTMLKRQQINDIELAKQAGLISEAEAKKRIAAAEAAEKAGGGAAEAVELLTGRLADLKSSIDSSVNSALMGINDAIINGTEENKTALEVLRDAIGSIFISIQEEVYKQTIANPLSDMISSWLVGGIKQLNIKDIRGSSLSGVLGSARGAVGEKALAKNVMGDAAVNKGAAFFKGAGDKVNNAINSLGTGVNAAAGAGASAVSNAAGVLASTTTMSTGAVATANTAGASTLMSSLGPILAVLAVIAAIMALFGGKKGGASKSSMAAEERAKALAQSNTNTFGSIPRMASGGMMRDRVPALLEPGEFVIRKPIARKIGASNLAQMNATGNTGSTSAPTINIKNEGSPKTAEASPPRFDGEKYVIDVIMRDLSTNGPIRRTLRGGAL